MVTNTAYNNAKFSSLVPYAGTTLKNTTTYKNNIELNAHIYSTWIMDKKYPWNKGTYAHNMCEVEKFFTIAIFSFSQ